MFARQLRYCLGNTRRETQPKQKLLSLKCYVCISDTNNNVCYMRRNEREDTCDKLISTSYPQKKTQIWCVSLKLPVLTHRKTHSICVCISHPCDQRISFWLYCVMMTMIFEFIRNYIILTWHYYLLAVGSLATLLFPFSCLIECCLDFYFKKTNLFERRW